MRCEEDRDRRCAISEMDGHGPASESRADIAQRQAELLRSLVTGAEAPAGFVKSRMAAASDSLLRKRARALRKAWPELAEGLGARFDEVFAEFAAATSAPSWGGALADGYAMASWLRKRGMAPEGARLHQAEIELMWVTAARRWHRRRGVVMRSVWMRDRRRWCIGASVAGRAVWIRLRGFGAIRSD